MTAPSPLTESGSLTEFTIKVANKEIDSGFQVASVDTWVNVNKVPRAQLVIYDGSASDQDFKISNLDTFLPGKEIEILAGYDGKAPKSIFKGLIVKQGLNINQHEASNLIVDITDKAMKMTLDRKNALYEKITDSDLIGKLITQNGLSKSVTATKTKHPEIVQYYASDWDLMVMRAELNSMVCIASAGKVTVEKPDTKQSPVLMVEYGSSILDLQIEMDAATQIAQSAIKSHSWDPATQKMLDSGPASVSVKEQGNVTSADLAKVFNVKKYTQQTAGEVDKNSLKEWSSAELLKSKLAKIRGSVRFQGSAKAITGKTIQLAGLGKRFNGNAYISGVHHNITKGVWLTTVDFGLSPQWFSSEAENIAAPGASGLLPPIQGLQTGIVKKITKDPDNEFRVFINLPLLMDKNKGVWARLSTFYASNKIGAYFYPEVNDEVIVGFMNQDPRYPVILGSVYSKKLPPPYTPDNKNKQKAIMTKSKLEINFDDTDKIIQIKTPGKHVIKMDDKSGAISIKDSNKNTVSLSKGGIALDSASNIKITAKGNITLQAKGNLKASAKANATMDGLQVSHKAKTKFSAKGNAQSELTASGMLTIRGGIVKIN